MCAPVVNVRGRLFRQQWPPTAVRASLSVGAGFGVRHGGAQREVGRERHLPAEAAEREQRFAQEDPAQGYEPSSRPG